MGMRFPLLILGLAAVFLISGCVSTGSSIGGVPAGQADFVVYKSPDCGCCVGHVAYLRNLDFTVDVIETRQLASIKSQYNIPYNMQSCHTAVIEGYFVEGHVPIEAISKLLEEKPDIDGIALPDMPAGSPGMPGIKSGPFIIYALKNGEASEFMRI
jgi:hypothetical protein